MSCVEEAEHKLAKLTLFDPVGPVADGEDDETETDGVVGDSDSDSHSNCTTHSDTGESTANSSSLLEDSTAGDILLDLSYLFTDEEQDTTATSRLKEHKSKKRQKDLTVSLFPLFLCFFYFYFFFFLPLCSNILFDTFAAREYIITTSSRKKEKNSRYARR
jgi:hypothetical protein